MKPVFYQDATAFRAWLAEEHATAREQLVGFARKGSGRGGLTYAEALDEALAFGWIDGVRRRLDAERYTIRFTPRKPGSIWSNVNVAHVARLTRLGRMQPAGLAAFAARTAKRTGVYSFENAPQTLPAAYEKIFRREAKAWAFFMTQAPGYRRRVIFKLVSAKQEATRRRWLDRIMAASAAGRRVD